MKKSTIVISVIEAIVLLVMKLMDWKESKSKAPLSGQARSINGHRVVTPPDEEYTNESPTGEQNAAYFPRSSGPADEKIYKKK